MKVVLIYHGGVTPYTRSLYRAIAAREGVDRLTVIVPERVQSERVYSPSGWLTAAAADAEDGYELIPIPLNDPTEYGRGFDRALLQATLKQANADVIQVLDEPFSGYLRQVLAVAALTSRRSKIVFYGFENRPLRFTRQAHAMWKTLAWPRTAGGAAANSEALANLIKAGYPRRKPLERIFWGIPTELFAEPGHVSPSELRVDGGAKLVGYVGRLVPDKGLFVLAAAMLRLPAEVNCVMIGSGPMRGELELFSSLPELRGRIHFRNALEPEDLARAIRSFDVLTLPSLTMPRWKEQYGRVLGEGMAAGVPVVGSDSGAIPEVIADAGIVVRESDPEALAEALHTAIFDDSTRSRLIESGKRRAEDELSTPVMAGRLVSLYERVLTSAC